MRRLGVLFVGLGGATASTAATGGIAMAAGAAEEEFGATSDAAFENLDLVSPAEMQFGGWDFVGGTLLDAVRRQDLVGRELVDVVEDRLAAVPILPGFHTALDIPPEESHHDVHEARSVRAIVEGVQRDIVGFRDENELEEIVVVYAASPPRSFQPSDNPDPDFADEREHESLPASVLYAAGAALAGAHFIDFTPSETLELQALHALAAEHGIQLAGRDGSTGQTMFKMTLGELLRNRRLRVRSWYSTNLIGNHDGYVLSLPGHDTVKLRDKTDGLSEVLGYDDFEHLVRIEYLRRYGDDKHAWDSIECDGWLGSQLQISIDWRGQDSFLAAPMVLDLCRLVEYGSLFDLSGIQPQLGWFFKRPLGSDVLSPSVAFERMVHFYRGLADGPSE